MPVRLLRLVPLPVVLAFLAAAPAAARFAVFPGTPEDLPATDILFETAIPLNEIPPSGWTAAQQKEIAALGERLRKDDRLFLLVHLVTDPIGAREENEAWGLGAARAVATRLKESGIRGDRIVVAPSTEERDFFGRPSWAGFESGQKVVIRGFRGGDWLKRPAPVEVAIRLPPEGTVRIEEPEGPETDRSNHILRGTVERGVRTVAIAIGRDTKTADVLRGVFEVPVSLRPGENRIVVTALDRFGRTLRAEKTVRYTPPPPSIVITAPAPGATVDVSRDPVAVVRGEVRSGSSIVRAVLIQNDSPGRIRLRGNGTFEQRAVLLTEEDVFTVEATDARGATGISAPVPVRARGIQERPLMTILQWDQDDVDLDLHVTDAEGRHTHFDAPDVLRSARAIPSGRLWLDNRDGYGPEVFSLERETAGAFTLSASYYRGKRPCRAYLTVVLNAGSPSRRTVRVFGPIDLSTDRPEAAIARVTLPEGTVLDLSKWTESEEPR